MIFRTHLLFSIAVAIIFFELVNVSMPFTFFLFVLIATLFVDIDSPKSKAGKGFYLRPIQFFFKHRGAVHSLLFAVVLSALISAFIPWAGVGFFIGYVSHLFLDFLTRAGVPLLWPLSSQKFGLGFKTSGIFEEILFVFLIFLDLLLFLNYWFNLV